MRPDLLIVGDSHTGALHEAALARGLDARLLFISGNHWHANRMSTHKKQGMVMGGRARMTRKVEQFAREAGGSVFPRDVPVLASFGYHLGRLAPLFGRYGHTPDAQQAEAEDRLFVSPAFLWAYIGHHRGGLLRILQQARKSGCDITVIAPPLIQHDPVATRIAGVITTYLRAQGLPVFDPRTEADWAGKPLPDALRAPDGGHGNATYGAMVLDRLTERGLLKPPLPSPAAEAP